MKLLPIVMTLCVVCLPAFAQPGAGAKYGARDPHTCSSTMEPAKGAPSPEQAAKYVACAGETVGMSSNLFLLENVKVEVGKGIPWMELDRPSRPTDADTKSLVYSIRGSYTKYQCGAVVPINRGQNCSVYYHPKAVGTCYRTNFGDWHCNMQDFNFTTGPRQGPPR
jgi:hypothetical protein